MKRITDSKERKTLTSDNGKDVPDSGAAQAEGQREGGGAEGWTPDFVWLKSNVGDGWQGRPCTDHGRPLGAELRGRNFSDGL